MSKFSTKIVLVGASNVSISELLPNHVVVGNDNMVVINPLAQNDAVVLETWTDEMVQALAHMSNEEYGVPGEYFTKLGSDTKNFIAQKIYKSVAPISESNSLIGESGKRCRAKGIETGVLNYRKSTVDEIIKHFTPKADNPYDFTIEGTNDELVAFSSVTNLDLGELKGNIVRLSHKGLVDVLQESSTHYNLATDWDNARLAVQSWKPNLPTINGYDGTFEGNMIVYGCARIPVAWFIPAEGSNRRIKSLELSSEITINADDFAQIVEVITQG